MKKNTIAFFIAVICVSLSIYLQAQKKVSNGKQANAPSMKNTIDTPYYVPAVKIPTHVLASLDSITTVIMPQFGKSMSVDDAEQYKQFYNRQISRIIRAAIKDSIQVTTKK